ncbi:sugar porter family MFS transporter [Brachybacterium sp. p3-SID957]|uniref:sugar porter family MFS transporter n=1 Tax=Brachybacterium sp. p3-SID957 TaxID=2916049 RepID=UPI00223BF71A|nr:sugar porter family MFS transporter [Brachybacterium sp. p3-SID957]MCT1776142.1 sugar porter family MFS transporter [Brachybacterium sp. p3-SID957]
MSTTEERPAKLNPKVVGISIAAAVGGFLFGFDTSVINGAVSALSDEFSLGAGLTGFAVSSALIGCAVGAWFAGGLANRFGRVPVMVVAAILFFISAIGSGLAFGVWDLIVWRVIGGLGVGTASVIAPAYIAEVAPARYRGRLGSLQQLAIVLGIFTALLSNAVLANTAGGAAESLWLGRDAWRWMFMIEAIPAAVYGLMALKLPESPRFLVSRDKRDEASRVLYDFTGELDVNLKIQQIQKSLEREEDESFRDLLGGRFGLKPIVWIGILLSLFQQLVGINVIFYYSTTLWQSVGFDESQALLTSTITSVMNILATVIAILLVDKVGRRVMLLVGSAGMTLSLGLMAVAFSFGQVAEGGAVTLDQPWSTLALVGANAFVMFFGTTWGPLVWVLLGEIFPNRIRASALAVAAAAQWAANFAISTTFPALSEIGLTFAYGLYAAFALISFVFVFLRVPETKDRELEDMDDLELGRAKKDTARS